MKKNILKLVLFSGVFAFFAASNTSEAEAQKNPCPIDGPANCAVIGDITYHGPRRPVIIINK